MAALLQPDQIIRSKADTQRPLIHHLNADNSWLLQVPRASGSRLYFNILFDPWFVGNQIETHRWFHEQEHTEDSAVKTIADVEHFVDGIETLARKHRNASAPETKKPESYIDAVSLTLPLTDHTHKETLTQLPPSVPIFSNHEAALKIVRGWKYFDTVVKSPDFTGDWTSTSVAPLPNDIGISAMQSAWDLVDLHAAVVVTFKLPKFDTPATANSDEGTAECILLTPHGIQAPDASALANASPPIKVLAQLHPLLRVKVGFRFAHFFAVLGAGNGLELSQSLQSKYWLPTHDEPKVEKGFTSWTLTNEWLKVEDVAEEYSKKNGTPKADIVQKANYHDIGNGGSLILV